MERERRNRIRLAGLALALVAVSVWAWKTQSSVLSPSSKATAGQTLAARRPGSASIGATELHLKALVAERSKPMEATRNLFRFKPKPLPPPPPPVVKAAPAPAPVAPPSTDPAPPPLAQPIALKFIGLVQTADKTQRLAVLSDGRGSIPIYGKEGDIIEGRYRIVRIGAESIELAYLDGRGRQTIRLSGA